METKYYIAVHRDDKVWKRSSSGGAFSAITDAWLAAYGEKASIYGCAFDGELNALHIRATTAAERNQMCGSKYIGSNTTGVYRDVARDLQNGMHVCFSGTPCQIGALKSYLRVAGIQPEDRLLTVDFICHGVASTRFFRDYLDVLEKKYGSKAISCTFRAKSRPERRQDIQVGFANGKSFLSRSTRYDWFYAVYFRNLNLRPACYGCRYASEQRCADITIADHWDVKTFYDKAESLLLVSTHLGELWTQKALADMDWTEVQHQAQTSIQSRKPGDYDAFWKTYLEQGYFAAQKLVGNNTLAGKAKYHLVSLADDLHILSALKKIRILLRR